MLPNRTWVHSPMSSKANLLILGCGEGKYSIYCRALSKENGQSANVQKTQNPHWLSGKDFKVNIWGKGCSL